MTEPRRNRTWTPEEDAIVRATMHLPLAAVAARLPGRTPRTVSWRRLRINGTVKPKVKQCPMVPRGRAHWLIAKTCVGCGDFLPAASFPPGSRSRHADLCLTCRIRASGAAKRGDQAATRPTAEHHYQRWTIGDLDIIMATDEDGRYMRTAREAALLIGRTALAVQQARIAYHQSEREDHDDE